MRGQTAQAWALARHQHGVVTRGQLLGLGLTPRAIDNRIKRGRLHPVHSGTYAVGRPTLSRHGLWTAAVLSCGVGAALSHESAAAALGMRARERGRIEVSVPLPRDPHPRGIVVHRRAAFEITTAQGIPVTTPECTLVDLANRLAERELERAVNEADRIGLTDPEALRSGLERFGRRPGLAALRRTLDRHTFRLTDSELERRFLALVRAAGLPAPVTGRLLNGVRVDFYWPDMGLVVETDGLRYHRTPAQQARDQLRDQAHVAAGLTSLRFTHSQVTYDPEHVRTTLLAVAQRLRDTGADAVTVRMGEIR